MCPIRNLPLNSPTPPQWASEVLKHPLALLSDQAYLEKKAANNALEFLNLWPTDSAPVHWLSSIATIARDETLHLQMVLKLLERKGGALQRTHKNPYASDLGKLVRRGKGHHELLDRLLVSALIEARSCERFTRLSGECADSELSKFYGSLVTSENGHYRLFLEMAEAILPSKEIQSRWEKLLEEEADIIQRQPAGPRIHSGLAHH